KFARGADPREFPAAIEDFPQGACLGRVRARANETETLVSCFLDLPSKIWCRGSGALVVPKLEVFQACTCSTAPPPRPDFPLLLLSCLPTPVPRFTTANLEPS
ncbi:unnamed protein product, partial [Ectocarpus sp. 13 AM-2016]